MYWIPKSGKHYFLDCIVAVAYNVDDICRDNNKTDNFALEAIVSRRLVVGNKVFMKAGAIEDFGKLCEGTAFSVRVKHNPDKIFNKLAVLLISNDEVLHLKISNVNVFRWSCAPFLKDFTKNSYPLAVFDVFDYFNVNI